MSAAPSNPRSRNLFASLDVLKSAARGGLVDSADAATAWGISLAAASLRLHRFAHLGLIIPVRKGLFFIRPEGEHERFDVDEPIALAGRLFAPCYVGGWTAIDFFGMGEGPPAPTFVVTSKAVRSSLVTCLEHDFRLVRVEAARVLSVIQALASPEEPAIATQERALADGLANPEWVGGAAALAHALVSYRFSSHWSPSTLLEALALHPKGVAYKRLGYLAETVLPIEPILVNEAQACRSTGVSLLDPSEEASGPISSRWGLRLNAYLAAEEGCWVPRAWSN